MLQLLRSAGLAVRALASPTATDEESSTVFSHIGQQKEAFSAAASEYFTRLYSIDVGLRTQINALEEAKIIPPEEAANGQSDVAVGSSGLAAPRGERSAVIAKAKDAVTGGGLGNLDVGWLNSRNDYVGKQMEAELWKQASEFLTDLESKRSNGRENLEHVLLDTD